MTRKFSRPLTLILILGTTLAFHGWYKLDYLGEQDAARLVVDAILWHHEGEIETSLSDYRARVVPGTLFMLKTLLDLGMDAVFLPAVMNYTALLFSTVISLAFYLFALSIGLSASGALTAVILFNFTPALWVFSLYGYPHTLSLGLFMLALLMYSHMHKETPQRVSGWYPVIALTAILATLVKVDILICFGGFLAVALAHNCSKQKALFEIIGLGTLCLIAAIVAHAVIVHDAAPSPEFADNWDRRFPLDFAALLDSRNFAAMTHSAGPALFFMALLASSLLALSGERRLSLLVALWTLPPLLFWSLRYGNSARHVLQALPPLILCLSFFLSRYLSGARTSLIVCIAFIIGANYLSTPSSRSTVAPSARFVESATRLQNDLEGIRANGARHASYPAGRKLIIGGWSLPYLTYEMLKNAEKVSFSEGVFMIDADGGRVEVVRVHQRNREKAIATAKLWLAKGYYVSSIEHAAVNDLNSMEL